MNKKFLDQEFKYDDSCALCKSAQDSADNLTDRALLVNFVPDANCGHKL